MGFSFFFFFYVVGFGVIGLDYEELWVGGWYSDSLTWRVNSAVPGESSTIVCKYRLFFFADCLSAVHGSV